MSDGVVYITSWDHYVYALGEQATNGLSTGTPSWLIGAVAIIIIAVIIAVSLTVINRKSKVKKAKR